MRIWIIIFSVLIMACMVAPAQGGVAESREFMKNIHWLGHDTFRITAGNTTVYVDPFRIKADRPQPKADIIVITHDHHDHCSVEDVAKIVRSDTIIVSTPSCAAKLTGTVKTARRGDVTEARGVRIEAVPAYNIGKRYHPKDADGVGYILTIQGKRLYFAGDTDHIPEMKDLKNIAIAFLPVSGTYVMTETEAADSALDIKPDIAVPIHWGVIIGTRMNAELFAERLKGKVEVIIMREE